ncbi:MAG: hypothetical protein KBD16_00950 [Candidatus Pacebacteria bacterium]|nr:hypothetical protein [Candidatus Paceibacterota bacterium]
MKKDLKVYVGYALTGASASFKNEAKAFQEALGARGITVLDFWKPKDREAVEYCLERVGASDAMIAIVSQASFGLGYEVATALHQGKPVLMLAHSRYGTSQFATENPHPKAEFDTFTTSEELLLKSMAFLEKVSAPNGS